jgi:hypothetical protein
MDEFDLDRGRETLCQRVVPAMTFLAHADRHAES